MEKWNISSGGENKVEEEALSAKTDALRGCLIGTAVGDAMGLPMEGLSRERQIRLFPSLERYSFLLGKGMCSDDSEHASMTAQALLTAGASEEAFIHELARLIKVWLLLLPAGVGFATLRSGLRLIAGISPERSGVSSAGNGPAMRSPIIGVFCGNDYRRLRKLTELSTGITHRDARAHMGALAVACASSLASGRKEPVSTATYRSSLENVITEEGGELLPLIEKGLESVDKGISTAEFASLICPPKGVSGYICHTVPVVIHAWLSHQQDFKGGITGIIRCGGDTDTTAAILGGIIGSHVGLEGIPSPWIEDLLEWPRSPAWMRKLGERLGDACEAPGKARPLSLPLWGILPRNLFFALIVLLHGFRRLLPPY
ncbi:MAG: ADP-ribosylglycohydrolase family protein [Candidatus Eremiobacteraeota bacterium]|nr:ADP-ribosylglycohydrolase family protein [Candidatus Eremiobacteraeota bacterium]